MLRKRELLTVQEKIRRQIRRRRAAADNLARRRAEVFTTVVESVSRDEIIERDGKTCYLCGKETSIHDDSLDHVVPLARGGSHTKDNVRLAHRRCNSKKGKKLISEVDFSEW